VGAVQPLLNQLELFDKLVILDNGHQELRSDIENIIVVESEVNRGVAGSWNWVINNYKEGTDWILFLNDDIQLNPVQLHGIVPILENNPDKVLLCGPYYLSVFALNMNLISQFNIEKSNADKMQIFDEKFYPAYFEDNDLIYRIFLTNPALMRFNVGSMCPAVCRNSQTIEYDPTLNKNYNLNQGYYITKWGGLPGNEQFNKPFNE
jgi:GT2 family glycosyltransferase